MRERAACFGPGGALVGITCEPDGGVPAGRPALLLFNIGIHHRVGLGRVNVDIAREAARHGLASLRFDLAGLGDSSLADGTDDDSRRLFTDLRHAMDHLQSAHGVAAFVPVGLCSGTDGVHAAATSDPRVTGAVYVDGYAYTTPTYHLLRALQLARWATDPFRWRRWLRRRYRKIRGRAADVVAETGSREPIFDRAYPPREQFRSDLDALVDRGTRMLFVYSADGWFFNHRSQFAPMVGWPALPEGVEVDRWPDADHSFSTLAIRRRLVTRVASWIDQRFPAPPAGPADPPRGP